MSTRSHERQSFRNHLLELRTRLLFTLVFLALTTIVGYFIHDHILDVLIHPLDQPIYYSSPAGGFDFVIKLSFLFGFLASIPVITFQALRFLEPVLPHSSPRYLALTFISSCLLLVTGMAFAYLVSLPAALYFLGSFTSEGVQALISAGEYYAFVTRYLLGFGLLFQLPLVMLIFNSVQPISTRKLMSYQRWVVLVSFVIAAFLTPTPDLFNQLLMAVPLMLLYQVTVVLLWIVNRKASSTA